MGKNANSRKNAYGKEYFDRLDTLEWKRKNNLFPKYESQCLELLEPDRDDIILDAGCGTGWHIYHYANQCLFVIGVDLSKEGVKRASERLRERSRHTSLGLIVGDVEKLPLSDNSVDKILCVSLIEHLEYPASFLLEARRVLRENGVIIIGTPNRWDLLSRTLQFIGYKTWRRIPLIGYADRTHTYLFTVPEIKALLCSCGFQTVGIKTQYSLFGMKTFGGELVVKAVKINWEANGNALN